jgi:hypothetical protein
MNAYELELILKVSPVWVSKGNIPEVAQITFKRDSHKVVAVSTSSEFRVFWQLHGHVFQIFCLAFENGERVGWGLLETASAPHIPARVEIPTP